MEYIQLVDWTGRVVRERKRGAISEDLPSILDRPGIAPDEWLKTCCHIERNFGRAIGPVAKITELCDKLGQQWLQGVRHCRRLYAKTARLKSGQGSLWLKTHNLCNLIRSQQKATDAEPRARINKEKVRFSFQ